jgi:Mrp family chromosome partitioning ATPase
MKFLKSKKQVLEVPELVVPQIKDFPAQKYSGEVIDSLRQLISKLNQKDNLPKSIALTAALRQEGVSYLSQALAAAIAHDLGRRVCLVELNYWWPNPDLMFIDENHTLSAVIKGRTNIHKAAVATGWPDFNILPAGDIQLHSRPKVANSEIIKGILAELEDIYDHLILDIPAVLATTDAVTLTALASTTCLVIHQGVTHAEDVTQALDLIEHVNIAGVILNRSRFAAPAKLLRAIA